MKINNDLRPADLRAKIEKLWQYSAPKILSLSKDEVAGAGTPVFTINGKYTARGWTEWTQGFVYGSAILQFDATGDERFLEFGRRRTFERMAHHVTHAGVHDHGFNNVSTYGNLWRLMREGRIPADDRERAFYELALKCSGAVQASRWTFASNGEGFIYSFNGPHSLFADTMRSLRALALSHQLGHVLMGEKDEQISLLKRLIEHARLTAKWNVYYGASRDIYDERGRTAHESLFNVNDGSYRCPSTQQGYSAFSTWTRGLAWIMLGYAEELEWIATRPDTELDKFGGRDAIEAVMLNAARARAISTFPIRRPTASRIGIPAHRASRTWATFSTARRTPSTITNPWTVPPPLLVPKACCGWDDTCMLKGRVRMECVTCRLA
jgi:hypothetical protein